MGLSEETIKEIVNLIRSYKKPEKVYLFGSRAGEDYEKTSDIDIAILGKDWTTRDVNIVKNMLNEKIKTPLKFDVLNFYDLSNEKLKTSIIEKGQIIYDS